MGKLYIGKKFGQAPNELLNRQDISLKAKGLFTFLQSKPNGWDFSIKRISQQTNDGKSAIRTGLKELEENGYLNRKAAKNGKGKWSGYDYTLSENPSPDNPSTGNPSSENHDTNSKKENSKKEKSKKENQSKDLGKLKNKDAKKVLDFFYENINPELPFSHKVQWEAPREMIKKYGLEKVMNMSRYTSSIQGQKYAPNVTTPYQMKKKLAQIRNYYERNKTKKALSI